MGCTTCQKMVYAHYMNETGKQAVISCLCMENANPHFPIVRPSNARAPFRLVFGLDQFNVVCGAAYKHGKPLEVSQGDLSTANPLVRAKYIYHEARNHGTPVQRWAASHMVEREVLAARMIGDQDRSPVAAKHSARIRGLSPGSFAIFDEPSNFK